jgi:DNA-binding NarL/FixJ family response regulator
MFSIHTDADRVFEALRAGAVGYLDKMTPLPMLAELLRQVAAGGSPMSPSVARHVIRHLWPARQPADTTLTSREKDIVRGIEDGLSYKLIAGRLGVSLDTVRTHIRQIYRKLHVNSKAEVINRSWARTREIH